MASLRAQGFTVEQIAERVPADRRTIDRDLRALRLLGRGDLGGQGGFEAPPGALPEAGPLTA